MTFDKGAEILLTAVLLGGIAGLTVAGVIALLFEQKVELWEATLLASLAVSLLAFTFSTLGSHWFLPAFTANVALGVVVYWLAMTARGGDPRRFLAQDERRAMAAIQRDYANAAAHQFLGEIYHKQGRYQESIEEYRVAVDLTPSLPGEQDRLLHVIERVERAAADQRRCTRCGEFAERTAPVCPHCGARRVWPPWIAAGDPEGARRFWFIVTISLVGFVAAGLLHQWVGWWAWVGLVIWVSAVVIAVSKPEETIPVAGLDNEVDARIEENGPSH